MNRKQLREELKRDEGMRLKPYQDTVGKMTIGVGRNLTDVGLAENEVDYLLDGDIERCIEHALEIFPSFRDLPDDVQHVIVNMLFQLGKRGFSQFLKFIGHIKAGEYSAAASEALDSRAARQAPARFERHAERLRGCASP